MQLSSASCCPCAAPPRHRAAPSGGIQIREISPHRDSSPCSATCSCSITPHDSCNRIPLIEVMPAACRRGAAPEWYWPEWQIVRPEHGTARHGTAGQAGPIHSSGEQCISYLLLGLLRDDRVNKGITVPSSTTAIVFNGETAQAPRPAPPRTARPAPTPAAGFSLAESTSRGLRPKAWDQGPGAWGLKSGSWIL